MKRMDKFLLALFGRPYQKGLRSIRLTIVQNCKILYTSTELSLFIYFSSLCFLLLSLVALCPQRSDDPDAPYKPFNFVLMMIIALVGLIGNSFVILTFHKQKRQTSATMFLKFLALFDILLIISTSLICHRYVVMISHNTYILY